MNIALGASEATAAKEEQQAVSDVAQNQEAETEKDNRIVTTEEELEGFYIIKTILRETVDASRVTIRDTINYCGVLLDDTSHRPLARLYFNNEGQKHIVIFDEQKQQEKMPIETVDDIYKYADKLTSIARYYDTHKSANQAGKSLNSFTFSGKEYKTKYWKDLLIDVCEIVAQSNKNTFDNILTLSGRKKPFFSKNPNDLRSPKQIEGTDIFVETNIGAEGILRLTKNVISMFGYPESDLSIEVQ